MERNRSVIVTLLILTFLSSVVVSSSAVASPSVVVSSSLYNIVRGSSSSVAVNSSLAINHSTSVLPAVSFVAVRPSSTLPGIGVAASPATTTTATSRAPTNSSVCPMTLNETSGTITSPEYPRYYPYNQTCSWQITATKGNYFVLIIERLSIRQCGAACTCDYLEIQNGLSSDGVSSTRRCGYLYSLIYHVYHDSLKVLFVSDDSDGRNRRYSGFKATYTQLNYTTIPATCISENVLTESSGFFSSPNFPNNYPPYSRCTWNITVPSGYIIKISFLHFQLDYKWRGGAQLTITNVPSGVVTLDGDYPPVPVYSVGNSIQVTFISRANQYSGFNASYTAITYESLCPNLMTLNDTSGVITSPYYPRYYPDNQECSWLITASKGNYIVLIIEYMYFQYCGAAYTCDYLEIQNGLSSDGVSSARRYGYLNHVIYHVYHDSLKVLFVSDADSGAGRYRGFKATYTQVNYSTIPDTCISGELLTGLSGFLSSPNFPNIYPQYSRCTWNITVPSGYIIKISFLHFQLGSILHGGAQLNITNVVPDAVTLDGYSLPDPVYSVGNSIQVTFTSLANQYSGFNASYTAITNESLCPDIMGLNNTSGVITSPYYPRTYGHHKCSWQITASKGKRIKLVIEDMEINSECEQTCTCCYLEIQNGSFSSDAVPAGRMCGRLMGSVTLYSFHETLKVLYVGGCRLQQLYRGFKATYTQLNDTLTASSECYNYRSLIESNRARTFYNSSHILCDDRLSAGWYRFSGEAGSQMAESCVDRGHCGTDAPGWLNGSHPAVAEGAVQRRACFNHLNNCCLYSTDISVRNCGKFYVYKLDRPPHCSLRYCGNGLPLAPECSNYRSLDKSFRGYPDPCYECHDKRLSAGWYRFSGGAGNQMADRESRFDRFCYNSFVYGGWLSGSHPAVVDGAVQRKVCFSSSCYYSTFISVRNCGGFYVYKLKPLTYCRAIYIGNAFIRLTSGPNVSPTNVQGYNTSSTSIHNDSPRSSSLLKTNIGETEVVVEFVNKKTLSNGNPVRYFQMIVIQRTKQKDLGNPADVKYRTINRKYEDQVEDEPYITAEFSKDESRTTFTVGDGKYYSRSGVTEARRKRRDASTVAKYLNGKLESDTQYAVFQRSFDKDGGHENEGFIEFTTKAKFSTTILVSVVVVVVVLFSILGVGFIVWRCNRQNEPKMTSRSQRFSTQEIMDMSAINDPSTDPRRISASHQSNDHIPAAEGQVKYGEAVNSVHSGHGPCYNDVNLS